MLYFLLHLFPYAQIARRYLPFEHHHIRTFTVGSTAHPLHWPVFAAGIYRVVGLLSCSGLTILDTVVPFHYRFPNVSDVEAYSGM
jgi:hypothetical protein